MLCQIKARQGAEYELFMWFIALTVAQFHLNTDKVELIQNRITIDHWECDGARSDFKLCEKKATTMKRQRCERWKLYAFVLAISLN